MVAWRGERDELDPQTLPADGLNRPEIKVLQYVFGFHNAVASKDGLFLSHQKIAIALNVKQPNVCPILLSLTSKCVLKCTDKKQETHNKAKVYRLTGLRLRCWLYITIKTIETKNRLSEAEALK